MKQQQPPPNNLPARSTSSLPVSPAAHKADIVATLKRLGADTFDLWLPETRSLPKIIGQGEIIEGIIYGRYRLSTGQPPGRGVLVATNHRILFIDRKWLFMRANEIAYDVVSAIGQSTSGIVRVVTLSTRVGDISVRTFNKRCAQTFIHAIELHLFNRWNPSPYEILWPKWSP